tara:strand:- start:4042 stop:4269 length:228 start_codon:yes stop_codon:yes gene_type:complete
MASLGKERALRAVAANTRASERVSGGPSAPVGNDKLEMAFFRSWSAGIGVFAAGANLEAVSRHWVRIMGVVLFGL